MEGKGKRENDHQKSGKKKQNKTPQTPPPTCKGEVGKAFLGLRQMPLAQNFSSGGCCFSCPLSRSLKKQVIAASEVVTKTPLHPHSRAARAFFKSCSGGECLYVVHYLYGRALKTQMEKAWSMYCRLCLKWNRWKLLSSLPSAVLEAPEQTLSFLSVPEVDPTLS